MPSTARPIIGLTSYRQPARWGAWDREAAVVPTTYLDMVVAAGGWPLVVSPPSVDEQASGSDRCDSMAQDVLNTVDALVVIGGGDIAAHHYGQVDDPRSSGRNDRRDDLELALVDRALAADLPVLAICRGLQVLNVALGGNLVQHLPDVTGTLDHQPRSGAFAPVKVTTEPGTMVRALLGECVDVQCSHHQAIDKLGEGLMVTARSDDGIIEAVEVIGRSFAVGVQWHPEESGDVSLFAGLVQAARS